MTSLFKPVLLGKKTLKNRMVMAPLTRGRANETGVPGELMAEYYRQRASAGLIIAEATAVSKDGRGWLNSPGLFNDEQQHGWKKIADAVHQASGTIFVQLWHMGGAVHPDFIDGETPVSSSAVQLTGQLPTPKGRDRQFVKPRSLSIDEISVQVENFKNAARRAIDAGLDGVEIHAANGFLIDQFTRDSSNQRHDIYGGSIENRLRFMMDVVTAVCNEIGPEKVGIRLSPTNNVWGISDSQYRETFTQAVQKLDRFGLAYLHILEPKPVPDTGRKTLDYLTPELREQYTGYLIVNGGYNKTSAEQVLQTGMANGVAFGMPFIANPDLVERYQHNLALASPDTTRFYSQGAQGYTDYPRLLSHGN